MRSLIISAKYTQGTEHIRDHFHDSNEIIYLVGGRATVTVGDICYEAAAGTLLLISRFERHSVQADGDDYARYTLSISPDTHGYSAFPGEKLLSVLINRPENFRHALSMPGCTALLEQIVEEMEGDSPMKHKMLDLLFFQLLVMICREHPELIAQDSTNLPTVLQVQQYLESCYDQPISLESISQHFHLSQSYLSHMFKQVTGHTVMGYLRACRIAAAKRLLAETKKPVSEILDVCGFADGSNFSRAFKQQTGMTPSTFREKFHK